MRLTIIFCDLDGTIFDPDIRLLKAPWYNRISSRLMHRSPTVFIVTTGRQSWGPWTRLNYTLSGMRPPDLIIAGAGTYIYWHREGKYILDANWDARMKKGFDKQSIQNKLSVFLADRQLSQYRVPNPYMIVVNLYGKSPEEVLRIRGEMKDHLKPSHVKIVISEQLLFPNTSRLFNGYALIIPQNAGKDASSRHILQHYEKEHSQKVNMLAFGDASIDVSLLTMKPPENVVEYKSYGIHLTPLAKRMVKIFEDEGTAYTAPTLLEGSAPESIYNVLKAYYHSPQNSPYRALLSPFETVIDKVIYPGLTPNELTLRGLEDVRCGLRKIYDQGSAPAKLTGFMKVVKGHFLDAVDGIRARRHPGLKTPQGQLYDGYADRIKEFESLTRRGRYEAALTCILPSIARAQAECLGKTVPELDPAGGSALTRTRRLLTSLFFDTIGQSARSTQIDRQITESNIATFKRRKDIAKNFSWNISHLKTYDRTSLERLLLYTEMLQNQYAEISKKSKIDTTDFNEYLAVKITLLRNQLSLPKPAIINSQ